MALSKNEKNYRQGYNEGYKDGLKDQLTPHEFRKEEYRQNKIEDVINKVHETLKNSKEYELTEILAAIEVQEELDYIENFSAKKVKHATKKIRNQSIASSIAVLLVGGLLWYVWSSFAMVIALIYTILLWLGYFIKINQ